MTQGAGLRVGEGSYIWSLFLSLIVQDIPENIDGCVWLDGYAG